VDTFIFALDNWISDSTTDQSRPNGLHASENEKVWDTPGSYGEPYLYPLPFCNVFNGVTNPDIKYIASNDVPVNTKYFYPVRVQTSDFFNKTTSIYYNTALDISEKILHDVRNDLCKILFLFIGEGQNTSESRHELIYKQAELLNIKLTSIIFIDANMLNYVYKEKNILTYYFNCWEYHNSALPENILIEIENNIKTKQPRSKRFINFNRRAHLHRLFLTDMLVEAGIDKNMILTMGAGAYVTPTPHISSEIFQSKSFDAYKDRIQNIINLLPITYDVQDFYTNNPVELNIKAQLDAYICITSETYFYRGKDCINMFFSEKTFKPIVCLQPFIMVNYAHSLKFLRQLGYKTFSPYINESYDDIEDGDERLKAIFNEISRLNNFTDSELQQLMIDLLPVLLHNESVYRNNLKLQSGGKYLLQTIMNDWNNAKNVAMIGLGKLGKECAEVMAGKHKVDGYDINPVQSQFINVRTTLEEAVKNKDIVFIAVPTPHDPAYGGESPISHLPPKDFDYTTVKDCLAAVHKATTPDQLIVLISTVLPGTVRKQLIQYLPDRRFVYNPYLIAMGTVKQDMVNPEMIIIGTKNGESNADSEQLISFYKTFINNNARVVQGTWDEAESIKIFYNTFISAKLSLVNMVQDVAEKNGNINVDVVTEALKDSTYRIMGPAYMTAGMGDGGACHPRDNIALRYMAKELNLGYDLFASIMESRELQAKNIALRCLKEDGHVCIVGKAYKPSVPYINGSYSLLIGHYISENGGLVTYYDPNTGDDQFNSNAKVYLIGYWENWIQNIQWPDNCIVIDPWRKFSTNNPTIKVIHYGNTR
jgi:UDPglucose 6-dehydrogenase